MVVLLCSHRHSITLIVPAEHLPAEPRPGGATNPLLPRLHRPDVPSLVAAHPWVALLGWATWLTGGGKRNAKKVTAGSPASSQSPAGAGMAGSGRQRAAGRSLLLLLPRQAASSRRRISFNPFEEEASLCSGWTEQEKNGSLVGFVLILLLFWVVFF